MEMLRAVSRATVEACLDALLWIPTGGVRPNEARGRALRG